MHIFLQCIYALLACIGFCFAFNIHKPWHVLFASLGGMLAWFVYISTGFLNNDILQYFIATIIISIYAEVMARILKTPVTTILLVALLPLVPGGGIYNTMQHCLKGDTLAFLESGLHTLGIAGALSVAILLVSSLVRLVKIARTRTL
ncbi:MAG: threonine/serine exporter family protein [Bacillota bacterium]|nr:threonine/serine exporter family protein [Bacillota bacterium]